MLRQTLKNHLHHAGRVMRSVAPDNFAEYCLRSEYDRVGGSMLCQIMKDDLRTTYGSPHPSPRSPRSAP